MHEDEKIFSSTYFRSYFLKRIQFIALRMEQVEATCVFAEQEVEYELRLIMDVVNQSLKSVVVPQGTPRIELWNTPFYDIKVDSSLVVDFRSSNYS